MKPTCTLAALGLLAAVGAGLASPVRPDNRKPAAFPAGRYVLAGEKEAARGDDTLELTKAFRLRPNQFVLSGGPSPADKLVVDDDLEVLQDGKPLFIDDDRVASTDPRDSFAGNPVKYRGFPIVLVLDPAKKVRFRATDRFATEAMLGPVWLHRWDGARKKLTDGKTETSGPDLPAVFFDESFALADGWGMPERVPTDAQTELPERPASLLPRYRADR
jgi:hypothetical protein